MTQIINFSTHLNLFITEENRTSCAVTSAHFLSERTKHNGSFSLFFFNSLPIIKLIQIALQAKPGCSFQDVLFESQAAGMLRSNLCLAMC